jgi:hypothetical protein
MGGICIMGFIYKFHSCQDYINAVDKIVGELYHYSNFNSIRHLIENENVCLVPDIEFSDLLTILRRENLEINDLGKPDNKTHRSKIKITGEIRSLYILNIPNTQYLKALSVDLKSEKSLDEFFEIRVDSKILQMMLYRVLPRRNIDFMFDELLMDESIQNNTANYKTVKSNAKFENLLKRLIAKRAFSKSLFFFEQSINSLLRDTSNLINHYFLIKTKDMVEFAKCKRDLFERLESKYDGIEALDWNGYNYKAVASNHLILKAFENRLRAGVFLITEFLH